MSETTEEMLGPMLSARRKAAEEAHQRTREAIKRLQSDGLPVTGAALAREAGVSRSFLYDHYRKQLNPHGRPKAAPVANALVEEQNLVQSLGIRIRRIQAEHEQEVAELRRQVANLQAEVVRLRAELRS